MRVDARREKNARSILALEAFLRDILRDPASFAADQTIIVALKSQGALSKLHRPEHGIAATSINTVKRISDGILHGGFESMDRLRIAALDAIIAFRAISQRSDKTTKASLMRQLKELDHQLQQALQDAWHITMAFEKSLTQGRHYAEQAKDPAVLALCKKEQRELRMIFSLCEHPLLPKAN